MSLVGLGWTPVIGWVELDFFFFDNELDFFLTHHDGLG